MSIKNLMGFCVAILTLFTTACTNSNEPDVSSVKVDLKFKRFDKDFFAIDTNHVAEGLQILEKKYPEFLNFYLDTLMGYGVNGNFTDSNIGVQKGVRTQLTYPDFRGLFDSINKHYPNTDKIDAGIEKGFQYLKYYYPHEPTPEIIYLNSNLSNYVAFTYDTVAIGVGLDMYLGNQYPFYKSVGIPDYMAQKLSSDYIVPNVFTTIYRAKHPFVFEGKTLLEMIIEKGKEQYFLSKIIPFVPEHTRLGFTKKQLEWCENSEAAVYNFFIAKQLLYSSNLQQVYRYVADGPTSAGMPAESPGNIGSWLGLQIINAYAKKHEAASLQKILNLNNAQLLLQQSRYNPK
jgi:hypothetical protein